MAKNTDNKIYHQQIFLVLVNLKNEFHAFLGWPYYFLERLYYTQYLIFLDLFSLSYKESTIHAQYTHN